MKIVFSHHILVCVFNEKDAPLLGLRPLVSLINLSFSLTVYTVEINAKASCSRMLEARVELREPNCESL